MALDDSSRIYSITTYEGLVKQLLRKIKFDSSKDLCRYLGRLMHDASVGSLNSQLLEYDMFLKVPIHKRRLNMRGFNQVDCLFEEMLAHIDPLMELKSKRIGYTSPLFDQSLEDRQSILDGCFELDLSESGTDLMGKRVLILDDIVTTGSTVKELRRLLLEEGVVAVDCLCLAH